MAKKKVVRAKADRFKGMRKTQKVVLVALLDGRLDGLQLAERLGVKRTAITQRCAGLRASKLITNDGDGYTLTKAGLAAARVAAKTTTVAQSTAPASNDKQLSSDLLEVVTRDGLSEADRSVVLQAARRLGDLPVSQYDSQSGVLLKVTHG